MATDMATAEVRLAQPLCRNPKQGVGSAALPHAGALAGLGSGSTHTQAWGLGSSWPSQLGPRIRRPSGQCRLSATLRSGWQGPEEQAWHAWAWEVSSRRKDAATGWRLCLRPPSRRTRPAAHCPVSHVTRESQNAAALGRARPRAQPQRPVWGVRLRAAQSGAPGAWGTAGGRRAAGHPGAKTTVPREGRRREEDGAPGSVGPQRAAVSWACTGAPLPPEGRPWLATPDL